MIMIALLAALPLGYLLKCRATALLTFGLVFAHLFTFQTAQLVLEATRGSDDAFGNLQAEDWSWFEDTIGYLVVTTVVYAVGLILVTAGHGLAQRRARRLHDVGAA